MTRSNFSSLRVACSAAAGSLWLGLVAATPAAAQSVVCQEGQKYMVERKTIGDTLPKDKSKKLDARQACTIFGKLATNGTTLLKWAESNKEWCQIPDQFLQNIKSEHEKVVSVRGQACGAVAKIAEMEKKARQQAQEGGGGLLGGPGLNGEYKIPRGAL